MAQLRHNCRFKLLPLTARLWMVLGGGNVAPPNVPHTAEKIGHQLRAMVSK